MYTNREQRQAKFFIIVDPKAHFFNVYKLNGTVYCNFLDLFPQM